MPNLKPTEILLIVLVVLLLFGAKRLPDLARSVGKSLKILKTEVKDLREDDAPPAAGSVPVAPAPLPAPVVPAPAAPVVPPSAVTEVHVPVAQVRTTDDVDRKQA